ncbi:hypothetical protein [Chryseobacterium sp. EO14]|uniref:hypothetical protein n=1 Tax=Chryseobacterium sp. EO14 TaxID=2950551 RepID=UPI00210E8779|nr:hypothetical protein [Chryseobacterium sp. EO14]MCQ4141609.1 hypothetical protein [Chryseobacterium sp. EO14]
MKNYYMLLLAFALTLSMVSCRDEESENPVGNFHQKTEHIIQPFPGENTSSEEVTEDEESATGITESDHSDKGDDMPKK